MTIADLHLPQPTAGEAAVEASGACWEGIRGVIGPDLARPFAQAFAEVEGAVTDSCGDTAGQALGPVTALCASITAAVCCCFLGMAALSGARGLIKAVLKWFKGTALPFVAKVVSSPKFIVGTRELGRRGG